MNVKTARRMCPDCEQWFDMTPTQKRCATCQKRRKLQQGRDRYRELHPEPQLHPVTCKDCGRVFEALYKAEYCPACSTPEAKKRRAAERARNTPKKMRKQICAECLQPFEWPTKRVYCPNCSTPERRVRRARGRKVSAIIENTRDGVSYYALETRKKHEKMIYELVNGLREPENNREALIKYEALGRMHGGAKGSYGKEIDGYYVEKE